MQTIIAEKPSVAMAIAKIAGAHTKQDGYMEGSSYYVTWGYGHLVALYYPSTEGQKWELSTLPLLPTDSALRVREERAKDGTKHPDPLAKKQLNVIKSLFSKSDGIIVATDAGREGEAIFRYIYEYIGSRKPFRRLWISSLTDKAIAEGLRDLKDGHAYDTLAAAARKRAEADLLIGINGTRALTLHCGGRSKLSIGRVRTPTLGMICKRYLENKAFKSTPFWTIRESLVKNNIPFVAVSEKKYLSKDEAEGDKAKVLNRSNQVADVQKKRSTLLPPLLYDLTSLQKDANKKYGMTAEVCLNTLQSLYEAKVMTYPRTGSRYIPEDVLDTIPSLLDVVSIHPLYGADAKALKGQTLSKGSVDASKVTDHHALLPTENYPKYEELSTNQKRIYDMVVARMIEAFSGKCEQESTTIKIVCNGVIFLAKGIQVLTPGWKAVRVLKPTSIDDVFKNGVPAQKDKDEEGAEDEVTQTLPPLEVGDLLMAHKVEINEGATKPKPLLTEATLLALMESAGKDSDDEKIRDAMKGIGIGTPATRASIIEALFDDKYVERQGKKLIPTATGLAVYDLVKGMDICNPELTGKWENALEAIVSGRVSTEQFDTNIRKFTTKITADILASQVSDKVQAAQAAQNGCKCPVCGNQSVRIYDKNARCSSCGFNIWTTIAGKSLTSASIKRLLENGQTGLEKGFNSKKGTKFSAILKLKIVDNDKGGKDGKADFVFEDRRK